MKQKEIDAIRRCLDWEEKHPDSLYVTPDGNKDFIDNVFANYHLNWQPVPIPEPDIVEYQNQYEEFALFGWHNSFTNCLVARDRELNWLGIICRVRSGEDGSLKEVFKVNEKGERI